MVCLAGFVYQYNDEDDFPFVFHGMISPSGKTLRELCAASYLRVCPVDVLAFPDLVLMAAKFGNLAVVAQVVGKLKNHVLELEILRELARNGRESQMRAHDVSRNCSGGVAVASVVYGRDQRRLEIIVVFESAIYRYRKRLLCYPALPHLHHFSGRTSGRGGSTPSSPH